MFAESRVRKERPTLTRQSWSRLLMVAASLALGFGGADVVAPSVGAASPGTTVTLTGHGFGHGRGMGHYGALGYAIDEGWTYRQILDHFYGGSRLGGPDHHPTANPRTPAPQRAWPTS